MPNTPPPAGSGGGSTGYLGQIAAKYAAAGGAPTGGAGPVQDPPVYTGHTQGLLDPITGAPKPFTVNPKNPNSRVTKPASQMIGEFSTWSNKRKKELARKLAMAGYFGSPRVSESLDDFVASIPLAQLEQAWQNVVLEAAQKNANGIWVTPGQVIQNQIDYNRDAAKGTSLESWYSGKAAKSNEPNPNRTEKYTSVSRDIFSASEAKAVIREVLQKELGRDPTEEEFQDFKDALQTEQQQNPTRTVQSTVYRDGDPVRTSSTTTGGIDPGEFALEQAQANPDWAEWQAVGTYFPAAMNALGAGIPGA